MTLPANRIGTISTLAGTFEHQRLEAWGPVDHLPYCIRILLEAAARKIDGLMVEESDVRTIAAWQPNGERSEIPFPVARVLLQDFTGVPTVVDLAAMRDAVRRLGGDPAIINPQVPCDLVIDHSGQVDCYGTAQAFDQNLALEFERNRERYEFLRWGQKAFQNFRVVPPATGIIHQVNLEWLAPVMSVTGGMVHPDSVVGTDSHTPMINGLGVLGWGVGGIEAESVMLGQPLGMLLPDVIGVEMTGKLQPGVTATDLVLTVVETLRKVGVVDRFVEFFGPGAENLSLSDRAVVSNMCPEYGATCAYFPIDSETIKYLRLTGRPESQVALVESAAKALSLFRVPGSKVPSYTKVVKLDLSSIRPSLAGPKRPQDRVELGKVATAFASDLTAPAPKGQGVEKAREVRFTLEGKEAVLVDGSVVIAAITSCTNTSSPRLMIAAGLVAQAAVKRGLTVSPTVKTSLSPGSRAVTAYLAKANLLESLEKLGFQNVGYGCTTCIGNGGTLKPEIAKAIDDNRLVAAAVLSGNRNFEGRISQHVRSNWLASPPLVVAYALAGRMDVNLDTQPLGTDSAGKPVFLKDLWPSEAAIDGAMHLVQADLYQNAYESAKDGPAAWKSLPAPTGQCFTWKTDSTYIQEPPFFHGMKRTATAPAAITGARCLALFGDSITTDHISPAGNIAKDGPAAQYLKSNGVEPKDFNQFGARRGNDRVMVRGTFANVRIKNLMVPGVEGGVTKHQPGGEHMTIFAASEKYKAAGVPLIILAGKEYGTGSSRDWAAKGPMLLGVRAVIAESYERIHRSNLVGMGVLPLQFLNGQNAQSLGLTGQETFTIELPQSITPRAQVTVKAKSPDGTEKTFQAMLRLDTPLDIHNWQSGGILPAVIRKLLGSHP